MEMFQSQPQVDRCPQCGNVKSATWWNSNGTNTASAVPFTYAVPSAAGSTAQSLIPLPPPTIATVTTQTFDLCTCGTQIWNR